MRRACLAQPLRNGAGSLVAQVERAWLDIVPAGTVLLHQALALLVRLLLQARWGQRRPRRQLHTDEVEHAPDRLLVRQDHVLVADLQGDDAGPGEELAPAPLVRDHLL